MLKYVRHSHLGFVIWSAETSLWHKHIGRLLLTDGGTLISAGFCSLAEGVVVCWGKSESLSLGGKPDDAEELAEQLGLET